MAVMHTAMIITQGIPEIYCVMVFVEYPTAVHAKSLITENNRLRNTRYVAVLSLFESITIFL